MVLVLRTKWTPINIAVAEIILIAVRTSLPNIRENIVAKRGCKYM